MHIKYKDDDQGLETDCSPSYTPEILQQSHTNTGLRRCGLALCHFPSKS